MDFIIYKASDDYWYIYKHFSNIKEILTFMKESGHNLMIEENWLYKEDIKRILPICSEYMNKKDAEEYAKKCSQCQYIITIVDDYLE